MSRFFQGGVSDSDYSSSEEELLSSSEEEELNSSSEDEQVDESSEDSEFANDDDDDDDSDSDSDDGHHRGPSYFLKKSFAKDQSDDESSDDDDKKVVKSAKEKLHDDIEESIAVIDNSKVLNDWVVVLSEFDKLNRLLVKANQQNIRTPAIYIKSLAGLDDTLTKVSAEEKDSKKKLNASVAKAFNTVKQRVKKAARENKDLIDAFRASPDTFEKEQSPAVKSQEETPAPVTASSKRSADSALIFSTLRSVTESRGKKNVDIPEQIKSLEDLLDLAKSTYEFIAIYLKLIPLRFDTATNSSFWSIEQWKATAKDVNNLLKLLEENFATYRVSESAEPSDDIEVEPTPNDEGVRLVLGSVVSFVERLDDEFTRSLQVIDPYTTEYIDRLRDEQLIYETIIRAQLYTERVVPKESISKAKEGSTESTVITSGRDQIARIILRRIDHIYFKTSSLISTTESNAWTNLKSTGQQSIIIPFSESADYSDKLLTSLVSILYNQENSIYRKRAVLSHVYYYAHNNQYYKARDSLLISHLQSTIHNSEPGLQILFNRALVQLGLCAFRNGLIQEAHQSLQEIATSLRHKELLGQAGQRYNNQSTITDKQRLLPFHTHINLELLECVFLTSSLLIDIPQYAQLGASVDAKKRLQTKSFRRILEFHEKQTFQGPPENTRDYIMHAAKALQAGNWKKAVELLNSIKVWSQFPESDKLKESIKEKVQIEGLRTYLFQFKNFYSKLSIAKLSQIFELPESKVSAIVSKMIFHQEIKAGLDQVSNSIIFTKSVELSRLQDLALTLADRASTLAERNERLAGSHQHQGNDRHSHNSGNNNNNNHRHHHRNSNVKFAPVTGALSSAPGTISGALNGMGKRRPARA